MYVPLLATDPLFYHEFVEIAMSQSVNLRGSEKRLNAKG